MEFFIFIKLFNPWQFKLNKSTIYKFLTYLFAAVWLINGLFCKVLNFVPRHQEIVARILGAEYAEIITVLIGISEIAMAIWILTKFLPRLNAILQIAIVITMNVLEFILAPDLLLWGKLNILFALIFAGLVYYQQFILKPKLILKSTL